MACPPLGRPRPGSWSRRTEPSGAALVPVISAQPPRGAPFVTPVPPDTRPSRFGVRLTYRGGRASADPLGQGHDDPFRSAHVGHAPNALVLADAADQAVTVRGQPVDGRLQVVHLEGHVAQS